MLEQYLDTAFFRYSELKEILNKLMYYMIISFRWIYKIVSREMFRVSLLLFLDECKYMYIFDTSIKNRVFKN